jgi:hypothetical protein
MGQNSISGSPLLPPRDESGFLLACQDTIVPSKERARFEEHILCQILDTCNFLFLMCFLKIESKKWPNFDIQFRQMAKNYPDLALKASLETGTGGPDWATEDLLARVEFPGLRSVISIRLFLVVSQRFFLLRARTSHGHDQI